MTNAVEVSDLRVLAEGARREHEAVQMAGQSMLAHAIKCGKYVLEAREGFGARGDGYVNWLNDGCGITERVARRYVQVAEHESLLRQTPAANEMGLYSALELIKQHESVKRLEGDKAKAIEEAQEKGVITHKQAVELKEDLRERVELVRAGEPVKETERGAERKLNEARINAQKSEEDVRKEAARHEIMAARRMGRDLVDRVSIIRRRHADYLTEEDAMSFTKIASDLQRELITAHRELAETEVLAHVS